MKKNYLKLLTLGVAVLAMPFTFGQLTPKAALEYTSIEAHTSVSATPSNESHDFGGAHHGEHCFADHITHAWTEAAGITDLYEEQRASDALEASEMLGGDRAAITIPVIFHIVHDAGDALGTGTNVSTADLYALLDAVNLDFTATNTDVGLARGAFGFTPADVDIDFCLAAYDPAGNPLTEYGIARYPTTEDYYNPDTETNKMKSAATGGADPWDRDLYINVWVCDITNGATSGTAGYAYKPTVATLPPASIDGIVISHTLGVPPTNRVLTHELGHFLGLDHPWGGGSGSCATDDGLTDTPNTGGPSFDYSGSCSGNQEVCAGTQTQYENYMDYANCTVMYTAEQANLMNMVMGGSRAPLAASGTCTPLFPTPPVADFVADITTTIAGGSINFTDLSTNWPTAWAWTVTPSAGVTFIAGTSASDQNPVIQFANVGTYDIELTATNGSGMDTETKVGYITVNPAGGGAIACDTMRNWNPGSTQWQVTGPSGYLMGNSVNGTQDIQAWAEQYTFPTATNIRRVRFRPWKAEGTGSVTFNVYADAAGSPGGIVATTTMLLADMNENFYNEVDFGGTGYPVGAGSNFWVGFEPSYAGVDSFALLTNFDGTGVPPGETWMELPLSFPTWYDVSTIYTIGGDPGHCQFILDVLVSNGPSPTATVAWPPNETCEGMDVTMNGCGSGNTDYYYWDITDLGPPVVDWFYDADCNLTTNVWTEGNWEITLDAHGSCITDSDGPFSLTVNPPLSVTAGIVDQTCIAMDGEINFTGIAGGSGSGIQYSINSGATWQPGGGFPGLIAGDYDWIIMDDANCELTGTSTVGNNNPFAPTITPDQTITPGTPTDLTVTGGGPSWQWYEGAIPGVIGTTATINVAPTVTTTYYCNTVDASGCEADLEVTVFMDPAGVSEEDLQNGFTIYPNPSNGSFSLHFMLNEETDLNMEVVNILGERVLTENIKGVKNHTIPVNVGTVAEGVYFVILRTEDRTVSKKMVIKK